MDNLNAEYGSEWIAKMASVCEESSTIDSTLFGKYEVKRGLRDLNGQGVLTGLTEISEIRSRKMEDDEWVPCDGKLYYQGIDIEEIVGGFLAEKRFGYEEVVYLLLFGKLPNEKELNELKDLLAYYRQSLPTSFVRDIIMKAPSVSSPVPHVFCLRVSDGALFPRWIQFLSASAKTGIFHSGKYSSYAAAGQPVHKTGGKGPGCSPGSSC